MEVTVTAHVGQQPFPKIFSLEKPHTLQRIYWLINVLPPSNFANFYCASSFVLNHKELKIAETVQINQLFQRLNPICVYDDAFYGLTRTQVSKNLNNDVSKDSPVYHLKALEWSDKTNLCSMPNI